jgi:hypothetical protein
MIFEKTMQPPFSRSRSDLVSLARPFKAGKVTTQIRSRVATVESGLSTVATQLEMPVMRSPALKGWAKLNRPYGTEK